MLSRFWLVTIFTVLFHGAAFSQAHCVVRITEPNAVNPGEVSIAINPKNPDNLIGAAFSGLL